MFIDESGLSQRPHRCRTWSPRGQTPVLQYSFNWKTLSAMAGVTWWKFYFRLYPGSIRSAQVVQFLSHLMRHIPRDMLVIWDGLKTIVADWSMALWVAKMGALNLSICRPMRRSSIRWNTCGGTGNSMSFPTSVPRHLLSLAIMRGGLSSACGAAQD